MHFPFWSLDLSQLNESEFLFIMSVQEKSHKKATEKAQKRFGEFKKKHLMNTHNLRSSSFILKFVGGID